jgi:hypothetical protein
MEDSEERFMEAITEEGSEDLNDVRVPREKLDKFGNPVDENREDI